MGYFCREQSLLHCQVDAKLMHRSDGYGKAMLIY